MGLRDLLCKIEIKVLDKIFEIIGRHSGGVRESWYKSRGGGLRNNN